jgi:hypothetical protein
MRLSRLAADPQWLSSRRKPESSALALDSRPRVGARGRLRGNDRLWNV